MSHRILLVDDEDDILEFVRYNLQREGYEVFTARDGAEGVARALEVHPHLILLDRMMPRMDGLETCRRLREHDELKDTMIVFLTALGEDEHQLTGFAAGADDYISKPIKMHILVSRLKAILKRIGAGDAAPRDTGGVTIDPARYIVKRNGEEISLPRKEFALLTLLMSDPGRLFSREEIYSRVWGEDVVVGDRTIDVHIRKLRQKIGDEHIITVKGVSTRNNADNGCAKRPSLRLAKNRERRTGGGCTVENAGFFPKNRSGSSPLSQFSCAFGLIQKHQKIKHREK